MNHPNDAGPMHPDALHAEIAWYESRLREIGDGPECAYEKTLARSFEQALAAHRANLDALHLACSASPEQQARRSL